MNVMLLAAGEGTRLRPFTLALPKPAIPFLTLPLAAHALGFLHEIQIQNLVVNTFHLPHKIHELFHALPHGAKNLFFSDEQGEILGSGGGLKKAQQYFTGGGDFILMNADEVILPEDSEILTKAIKSHRTKNALATLLVMDHPGVGTQFGGIWTNSENRVFGFGKSAPEKKYKGWHFVGVQIISEKIFQYLPAQGASNILYDAMVAGISDGQMVQVVPFTGSWFETGNLQDFLEASKRCLHYLSHSADTFQKQRLMATLQKFKHEKFRLLENSNGITMASHLAKWDSSSKINGFSILGENCHIESGCHLNNVIVGNGIHVGSNTTASDTIII